ncbi:MAG: serine/threonine protein kinase [Chloroflexota bacterium]
MDRTVGPYQLQDSLGQLPFGELVAAKHPARSESLAVLLFHEDLARNHRFRGLVRLESARAGGLRHPGIARPLEIGEQGGVLYQVSERPDDAIPLAARLAAGPPLTQDQALALIRRLAEALDMAHGRRIAHGALSPASVLVAPDGTAALTGIGLLTAIVEAGHPELATSEDSLYVAPEQRQGTLTASSADGYALAVLADALLREQTAEIRAAIVRQRAAAPADRFRNCTAFVEALEQALAPGAGSVTASVTGPADAPNSPATAPWTAPQPEPAPSAPPPAPSPPPPAPVALRPTEVLPPTSSSTVDAPPADTPAAPLPWAMPAENAPPTESPWSTPPPPPTMPSPTSPAASSQASGPPNTALPDWLRESLDPSSRRASSPQAPPTIPQRQAPGPGVSGDSVLASSALQRWSPPAVTSSQPTPAMLEFLRMHQETDFLTMGVSWIVDRVPELDRLADRYAPEGKLGPVPLGVAVAGVFALLLFLLGQPAAGSIFVVLVFGLYGMPKIVSKMTAGERPAPMAVHVRGTLPLRRRVGAGGQGWRSFELGIGDGMPVSLDTAAYGYLIKIGTPLTIPWAEHHEVSDVRTMEHELPDVTVTYLEPGRLLLDVRDTDGAVVYRRPGYAGEAGDRLSASAQEIEASGTSQAAMDWSAAPISSRWQPTAHGHLIVAAMPPDVAADLAAAFSSAAKQAAIVNGLLLAAMIAVIATWGAGFFVLVMGGIVFVFAGAGPLGRALTLRKASQAATLVRIIATADLRQTERRGKRKSRTYYHYLRMDDGTELRITPEIFQSLLSVARERTEDEEPGFFGAAERMLASLEPTIREYELPTLTITYEASSSLVLEILTHQGETLYRDAAVRPITLNCPPEPE